jgi:antitoxin component YwqK of YwqJK toxin-antitoxin module
MATKPQQDLSLLPGEYYHPEAQLEEINYLDGTPRRRGHLLHGEYHGIWEGYRQNGSLLRKHLYLYGISHRVWSWYWSDGTLDRIEMWNNNHQIPLFIESLLDTPILDI